MKGKAIESLDGKISIRYEDIANVCMTGSIYALLQYILLMDEDTVKHRTCYMVGNAVTEDISSRLPAVHFKGKQTGTIWTPSRWFYKLYLRMIRDNRFPFLKSAKIYGLDLGFIGPLIGKQDYSLLSDGPLCMSQNMQADSPEYLKQVKKQTTFWGHLEGLLYGDVAIRTWGNNDQCKEFYMTEVNKSVAFKDKPVHIKSLQQMWDESTPSKRDFIRYVFDVSDSDIELLSSRKIIFLTQPMIDDRILTENEYVSVLKDIFSHYDLWQVLLKLHPRDTFDYKRYFPQVAIYDKTVNMQLLVLMGTNVERAVTICSTSINSFPESVEADWYGVEGNPKLKSFFGKPVPNRKFNQI